MSFYYEADIYLINVGWQFGLACSLGQLGMQEEGEEPGWEVWLGGGRCVTFSLSWYPTVLLYFQVLQYCQRRDEGVAVFLPLTSSLPRGSELSGAWI